MISIDTLGVQLYSVRDALAKDYAGAIREIATMGYTNVETTSFASLDDARKAKQIFDDLNLNVCAIHSPMPLGDDRNKIMDIVAVMGCEYVVCPWLDPDVYYTSLDGIKKACDMLNQANEVVQGAGLTLAYHNHWFEMESVEGKPAYQHMVSLLDESIAFELDVYWAAVAGLEPTDIMNELGERIPLLHVKDGPAQNRDQSMTAVGKGFLDIPGILAASRAKWHIVELDRCDSDMMEALWDSYDYLKEIGE